MSRIASDWLRLLFGKKPGEGYVAAFFSARLDETGTDGRSQYMIVAGGVSYLAGWDKLEASWNGMLASRHVSNFHWKEFSAHDGEFSRWGDLKRKNFVRAIEKIIRKNTVFQIAVAVDRGAHTILKKEWRGQRGFKSDSDYGLAFRIVRFFVCERLSKFISPDCKVQFIVEDGPFAADVGVIYQSIKSSEKAKYRPAEYAGMLAGFASVPKGVLGSLEVADYLAGRAMNDLAEGMFISTKRDRQLSMLCDREFILDWWNEDLVKEKERRRAYGKRTVKHHVPLVGQSS